MDPVISTGRGATGVCQAPGMARDLAPLVSPTHTAVLTMELQRGVVGDEALFPALVDRVVEVGLIERVATLCAAARTAGVRVVHCTMVGRPDGAGQTVNCKVFALDRKLSAERGRSATQAGTPGADLVVELAGHAEDIEVSRIHGMTPFTSTSLDQILRNLGVTTVIATGVSVNLGIIGMSMSAVDLGYQVVLPRDAVAGVPADYADAVIDNSLALLTTLTTVDDVLAAWAPQRD